MRWYLAGQVVELLCFLLPSLSLRPGGLRLLAPDNRVLEVLAEGGRRPEAARTDQVDDGVELFEVILKRSA